MKRLRYWWCLLVGHRFAWRFGPIVDMDAEAFSARCERCTLIWPEVFVVTRTMATSTLDLKWRGMLAEIRNVKIPSWEERHRYDREPSPEEYEAMFS